MNFFNKYLSLLTLTSLIGCSYPMEQSGVTRNTKNTQENQTNILEKQTDQSKQLVTFEFVKTSALKTCYQCHFNKFDTEEQLMNIKELVLNRVNKDEMPPSWSGLKPLSECEKEILQTWISNRSQSLPQASTYDLTKCAAQRSAINEDKSELLNQPLTFETLKTQILEKKCIICHNENLSEGGVVLETLKDLKDQDLIAKTAELSLLYKKILSNAKRSMPPASSGIAKLTEEEELFLKSWIDSGAN